MHFEQCPCDEGIGSYFLPTRMTKTNKSFVQTILRSQSLRRIRLLRTAHFNNSKNLSCLRNPTQKRYVEDAYFVHLPVRSLHQRSFHLRRIHLYTSVASLASFSPKRLLSLSLFRTSKQGRSTIRGRCGLARGYPKPIQHCPLLSHQFKTSTLPAQVAYLCTMCNLRMCDTWSA